jgi:uncharacterized protein DUF4432
MAYLFGKHWTQAELLPYVGHLDQIAGIKLLEGADGTERGLRLFEVWTGTGLFFHVLADRGMDISACSFKGVPLSWRSANGDVHPAYYDAKSIGWLRSFPGGLLVTGGLDHYGAASTDQGEEFGLHGRIGNLPARYVNYRTYWQGDEYELEIMGEVRQTRVFGENLLLRRRISTRLGSNQIQITDTVTNEGFSAQPHMILYHFNLGFPLVSPSTQLRIDSVETSARSAEAEAGFDAWHMFQKPTPDYREQVFRHSPKANQQNEAVVEVRNPELGIGLRWRYDKANLPYLFEWKQMGEGTYVLGIEPGNTGVIEGRGTARQQDDLPHLNPGESRLYSLSVEVIET